jgi:hypothetical protein
MTDRKSAKAASSPDLAELISVATKARVTSGEIETALAGARAAIEAATAEHDEAEKSYKAGLLTLDETALRKVGESKAAAVIRRDRATALVEILAQRLAETKAAEDETRRQTAYADARAHAQRTAERLRETYPRLAEQMRELLCEVYKAESLVAEANRNLPAGAEQLAGPEFLARGTPGRERRIVHEKTVELWTRPDGTQPAPNQDEIVAQGDGSGFRPKGRMALQGDGRFVKRQFVRREFFPAVPAHNPSSLATTIALPTLTGGWVFKAVDPPAYVNAVLTQLTRSTQPHDHETTDGRPREIEFNLVGSVPKAVRAAAA